MIHPKVFRAIPRITSFFKNKNFLDIFILSISNNIISRSKSNSKMFTKHEWEIGESVEAALQHK